MQVPRPTLIRAGLLGLLGLLVLGFGSLAFALLRPPAAERVLILRSSLDSQGKDLGPGMETLLSDYMEILAGATVTHGKDLPSTTELQRLPPGMRLLRFQGRRDNDLLALSLEWNTVARLLVAQPWVSDVAPARDPAKTMDHVVQHWPRPATSGSSWRDSPSGMTSRPRATCLSPGTWSRRSRGAPRPGRPSATTSTAASGLTRRKRASG